MQAAVKALNLKKNFRNRNIHALEGLDLVIERGIVFGLLGPNGAGKTTLIKILTGILKADQGHLEVLGKTPEKVLGEIGYVPEELIMYHYLTGMDFLQLIGGLRGLTKQLISDQINKYNRILDLPDLDTLISSYSKGNKEKILFIAALLPEPSVLILDEPFTGFDPIVIKKAKQLIRNYASSGKTVIFSTHILELAAQLCDEIAIISSGKIIGKFKPVEGKDSFIELESAFISLVGGENIYGANEQPLLDITN